MTWGINDSTGGRYRGKRSGPSGLNINRSAPKGSSSKGGDTAGSELQAKQESTLAKASGIADRQTALGGKMEALSGRIGDRDVAAGEAASDVASSYDSAIGQQNRNMQRFGVNPNSGRFAHSQRVMANARAAASAGARTRARRTADRESMLAYGQTIGGLGQAAGTQLGVSSNYGDIAFGKMALENQNAPSRGGFTSNFSFGGKSSARDRAKTSSGSWREKWEASRGVPLSSRSSGQSQISRNNERLQQSSRVNNPSRNQARESTSSKTGFGISGNRSY